MDVSDFVVMAPSGVCSDLSLSVCRVVSVVHWRRGGGEGRGADCRGRTVDGRTTTLWLNVDRFDFESGTFKSSEGRFRAVTIL